jgi:GT2 family glycosyltransferase
VRREVFERVGLLHEPYFCYFEELDFCLRAASHGYRSVVVADALAYHEGSRSIGARSPRRLYFACRNHLLLGKRCGMPGAVLGPLRSAAILGLNLAHAVTCREVATGAGLRAVLCGAADHRRGHYGPDTPEPARRPSVCDGAPSAAGGDS